MNPSSRHAKKACLLACLLACSTTLFYMISKWGASKAERVNPDVWGSVHKMYHNFQECPDGIFPDEDESILDWIIPRGIHGERYHLVSANRDYKWQVVNWWLDKFIFRSDPYGAVPHRFYSMGQEDWWALNHYFCGWHGNGTFVEMGALNGVSMSNTKFFQDTLGWSGLLVEANPDTAALCARNRKGVPTKAMATCEEGQDTVEFLDETAASGLRGLAQSALSMFTGGDSLGGVKLNVKEDPNNIFRGFTTRSHGRSVPCMPLGTMLHEANLKRIDLFSLDVEGGELSVLKTMDWSVPVCLWMIEAEQAKVAQQVKEFMLSKGYRLSKGDFRQACVGMCVQSLLFEHPTMENCPTYSTGAKSTAEITLPTFDNKLLGR